MPAEQIPFQPTLDRVLIRRLPARRLGICDAKAGGDRGLLQNPNCVDVVANQADGSHGDYRRVGILGVIVAVGPGKFDEEKWKFYPTTVKPGEVVMFTEWNDWADAPEGLYLVREGDIWGHYEA